MIKQSLGKILRQYRERKGWTLKQMSAECGIALSTLSKIEHDRLTLTYDRLEDVSRRLKLSMSSLLADGEYAPNVSAPGRKSVDSMHTALQINTPQYDYFYLHTDLRKKQMVPDLIRIRAKSLEEFGELLRHAG